MAEELEVWALHGANEVAQVASVSSLELEDILEETLVQRPEMLERGLHLVGRQTPTDSGPSDLLGVDAGGRLVVFELKREKLTRDAVTQCIDYGSALDSMEAEELAKHIADHSGTRGIEQIDDFEEWYLDRFADNDLGDLRPPRLVLVGLGVDERAERMARFLSEHGLDLSVLTFHGFRHGGETLLARQVEVQRDTSPAARHHRLSPAEKQERAQRLLDEQGLSGLFDTVCEALQAAVPNLSPVPAIKGCIFYLGGRRGRFCSVFADYPAVSEGLAISLPAKAHFDEVALTSLGAVIELHQWQHGGVAIAVDSEEHWEKQRAAVTGYLRSAAESWTAPPSTTVDARLRDFISSVPPGSVVTYGQVAQQAGSGAQAVGGWIRALPEETEMPWWRVVNAEGAISMDPPERQRKLLELEGVHFDAEGHIDLNVFQWPP